MTQKPMQNMSYLSNCELLDGVELIYKASGMVMRPAPKREDFSPADK